MPTQFPDLFQALAEPFDSSEVKERAQAGRRFQYITARVAMNRLDEVVGPENWWDEYSAHDKSVYCRLSIRLPDGSILTKCDAGGYAGMQDQGDDDKSGYSDAFKRAAVKFGIARYLYRNGVPDFVEPRPEPTSAREIVNRVHSEPPASDVDAPVSGKDLFRRVKMAEEEHQVGLLKGLNGAGKARDLPGRMVDWDQKQVEWGWKWVLKKLTDLGKVADHHDHHAAAESLNPLRHRLYELARDSLAVLYGDEFTRRTEEDRKREVKQEINNLLNTVSPGEVIDSLGQLTDRTQLERLIELADRTLVSRRKVQEEGAVF